MARSEKRERRWRGADEMLKLEREVEAESEGVFVVRLGQEEEDEKELQVSDSEDAGERGLADLTSACSNGTTQAHTDQLDGNSPNTDGATPVMLAVRDTDLFEGVTEWLPWEHRPVEVVQELLGLSVNLQLRDRSDCSGFHYSANINSPLEEEIIHMMTEALSRADIGSVSPLAFDKSTRQDLDSESEESDVESSADGLYPYRQTDTSPAQTPTHQRRFLTHSPTGEVLESPEFLSLPERHEHLSQDKGIPLGFRNAMETLRDIRQAYQDAERGSSRGGSSLLSSRDSRTRRWSHVDPAPSCGFLSPKASCLLVPPRHRQRTKSDAAESQSLPGLLTVAGPSQLSQSAPSVMELPLSSNIMTQARAHIQTRLGSHNAVNEQKGVLSALHPRTPKLLAPLDRRPRDDAAPPVLKHHVPLKPISQSPLSSRTRLRRERLSWGSPRTNSLATKGGSEESGSSSHSSMDLEDEDVEDIQDGMSENGYHHQRLKGVSFSETDLLRQEIKLNFKFQSKISHIPPIHTSRHHLDGAPISHTSDLLCTEIVVNCHHEVKASSINDKERSNNHSIMKSNYAKQDDTVDNIKDSIDNIPITIGPKEQNDNVNHATEPDIEINHGNACNIKNELTHVKQTEKVMKDPCCKAPLVHKQLSDNAEDAHLKTSKAVVQSPQILLTSAAHVDPMRGKKAVKASKPVQIKERRNSAHTQTNQSFNVLAHKERSIVSKSKCKSNVKCSSLSTQVKDKVKVKAAYCNTGIPSPRKKNIYHQQNRRTEEKNPEKVGAQQHTPVREPDGAQNLTQLTAGGTPRSKSAVDFIAYKDMFQQIPSGDDGPAIYEMFAGPIYENLRVSSTCENTNRQVQSSMSRKIGRQSYKVKHRPLKQPQCKPRKSPREMIVVPPQNKAKHGPPRTKPHVTPGTKKGPFKRDNKPKLEAGLVLRKQDDLSLKNDQDNNEDHMLYTIEEALSKHGSETLKPDDKTLTRPITHSGRHMNIRETSGNSSTDNLNVAPERESHQHQRKINTWTSSSGSSDHTIRSPVYQKFLDEVGDGPLTDDLLQCLAEELISLDETGVTIGPCSDNLQSSKKKLSRGGSGQDVVSEVDAGDSVARLGSGLDVDDTITWTKGEVLGRGAYGTVYCGLTSQGQLIAVKQVCLDTSDPDAAKREYNRLQEEVDLLKILRHTNIVGFLGTSLYQHVVSIFMEYIPGGSIASILHRFGPLPERVLALYTHQIVEGVAYLHLNRVIHRDLKGNNIMLMPTGIIKLIDFGCARRLRSLNHTSSSSGDLLKSVHGTPYWMAPEVISETGYGRKSDIWSVGCTVFEMATGKPPLAHMDKLAAMFYIGAQRGLMPSLPDEFSEHTKDFVQICLTSDQKLRPSADELLKHSFISKRECAVNLWENKKKTCCGYSGLCH